MTLAPQSASWRTQVGPDRTRVKSSTVKRASAFEARGKGIADASNAGFPRAQLRPAEFLPAAKVTMGPEGPELCRSDRRCLPAPGRHFGRRFAAPTWIKCKPGQPSFRHFREAIMNEEALNVSVRKFLKKVGITSQREIEQAVRAAVSGGKLKGNEALPAKVVLTVEGISLSVEIEGAIELE